MVAPSIEHFCLPHGEMLKQAGVAGLWLDYHRSNNTVSCVPNSGYAGPVFNTGHFDSAFCAIAHDWGETTVLPTLFDVWRFNVTLIPHWHATVSTVLAVGRFKAAAELVVSRSPQWLTLWCERHPSAGMSDAVLDIVCAAYSLDTCRVLQIDSSTVPGVHAIVLHVAPRSSTLCQTASHHVPLANVRASLIANRTRAAELSVLLPPSFNATRVLGNDTDPNGIRHDWPCIYRLPDTWSLAGVPMCMDNSTALCVMVGTGQQGRCKAFECDTTVEIDRGFDAATASCYRTAIDASPTGYCVSSGMCADETQVCDNGHALREPQRSFAANLDCSDTPECVDGSVCTDTTIGLRRPPCYNVDDNVPCGNDGDDTKRCTRFGCESVPVIRTEEECAAFANCTTCTNAGGCQFCVDGGCVRHGGQICAFVEDQCLSAAWHLSWADDESNEHAGQLLAVSDDDTTALFVRVSSGRVDRWRRQQSLEEARNEVSLGVGNATRAFKRTHAANYVADLVDINQIQFVSSSVDAIVVAPSCTVINSTDFSTIHSSPFTTNCQLFPNQKFKDIT